MNSGYSHRFWKSIILKCRFNDLIQHISGFSNISGFKNFRHYISSDPIILFFILVALRLNRVLLNMIEVMGPRRNKSWNVL